MKPIVIDLFCGLGGWSEGFLAEGWEAVGFDIERHDYGTGVYPGQRDILHNAFIPCANNLITLKI
jgi:site-specific DNA-cytosine methylase